MSLPLSTHLVSCFLPARAVLAVYVPQEFQNFVWVRHTAPVPGCNWRCPVVGIVYVLTAIRDLQRSFCTSNILLGKIFGRKAWGHLWLVCWFSQYVRCGISGGILEGKYSSGCPTADLSAQERHSYSMLVIQLLGILRFAWSKSSVAGRHRLQTCTCVHVCACTHTLIHTHNQELAGSTLCFVFTPLVQVSHALFESAHITQSISLSEPASSCWPRNTRGFSPAHPFG